MNKNISLSNTRVHRRLPKTWGKDVVLTNSSTNALVDFSRYTKQMHRALLDIKKFYEDDFNQDEICQKDGTTIDDYIAMFNDITGKLANILLRKDYKIGYNFENYEFNEDFNFCVSTRKDYEKLSDDVIVRSDYGNDIYGFSDEAYKKIVPLAKQMFMMEKYCSFVTRKIWQKEMTPFDKLDLNKDFTILARVVFAQNWRVNEINKKVKDYYDKKIYSSASLIDQKHKNKLIYSTALRHEEIAIYILEYDSKKIMCSNFVDAYSEEYINNENPIINANFYSSVYKIDKDVKDGNIHELFADATEIATPKGLLQNNCLYTEVDMKDAKVVGVIAPNKHSIKFATAEAHKMGVPLIIDTDFLKIEIPEDKIVV